MPEVKPEAVEQGLQGCRHWRPEGLQNQIIRQAYNLLPAPPSEEEKRG